MIEVAKLSKTKGKERILKEVSFSIPSGKITGFLGPNGAGKTTTFKVLLNLMQPDDPSTRIEFSGKRFRDFKFPMREIGASMEISAMDKRRKGIDHLRVFAPLAQVSDDRIETLMKEVGLGNAMNKAVGSYSLGMKQRLSLAVAMLGDPQFLILDEPANGLDPEGILWIRGYLEKLAEQGKTVIVSSHLLSEAQKFVDHVVVIVDGRIVYEGALHELTEYSEKLAGRRVSDLEDAYRIVTTKKGN